MSYIALARKYRPNNFHELIGQDVLVQTISNAIAQNRIHHAFLLTGIRGVGKTTTARIIAKNLNCSTGYTINPCESCPNCVSIANGSHPDVIEFDAASNTGIEDIKSIILSTLYTPTLGRKKVFIIDEIHMLSTKAFNALLKTLEEPPENVVFIFATTESRKIPITILSRCQKFFLKTLTKQEIFTQLSKIAIQEGYTFEEKAINAIAEKAGGSMRDGISILDQAILNTLETQNITLQSIKEMLKIPTEEESLAIFKSITSGNVELMLNQITNLIRLGVEEISVIEDIINLTAEQIKKETINKPEFGVPNLIKLYQVLKQGREEVKLAENKSIALEILFIKVITSWKMPSPIEIIEALKNDEISSLKSIFKNSTIIDVQD
jgi:DNA polymerase III subunit gamma/tau